jgi:protein-S-isoprenylcysteine O-methyltransferase Ste14
MVSFSARGGRWVIAQFVLLLAHGALCVIARAVPGQLAWQALGVLMTIGGIALMAAAMRQLGQALTAMPMPNGLGELVTNGLYAAVRHPIYTAVLLLSLGWVVLWQSLLGLIAWPAIIAFFFAKARKEERMLAKQFAGYDAYRTRTKMLIPGLL